MIAEYFGMKFEVPDTMIKSLTKLFKDNEDMKEDIDMLREMVYRALILTESEPKILNKEGRYEDFIQVLAIREAMIANNLLFNA